MNIAIIGAGASGLFVAYQLRNAGNNIDMYETQAWPGGNCFTTQVQVGNMARWADLAVNDFNQPMYQPIVDVMDQLGVAYDDLEDTESFFTSDGATQYTLDGGYGTPADPSFAGLLTAWGDAGARIMHDPTYAGMTVAQFLATDPAFKNYPQFAANCILPRVNAMYFCDDQGSSAMPVQTAFLYYYFQEGYGSGQPVRRRYFVNGSQSWAAALLKAVGSAGQFQLLSNAGTVKVIVQGSPIVFSSFGQKTYDAVVFACHAKDALTSYQGVPSDIAAILGGVKYVSSMGYAHVDPRVMPANQAAWRSYNVLIRGPQDPTNYTMSYLINDHQADAWNPRANYFGQPQYFVTLDPYIPLDPSKILFDKSRSQPAQWEFDHNVGNASLVSLQQSLWAGGVQGRNGIYFTGGWTVGAGLQIECWESASAIVRLLSGAAEAPHMAWDANRAREVYAPEYLRRLRAT